MNELADYALEVAQGSVMGPGREHNEDSCGSFAENDACVLVGVADGVSSSPGGEVASQMAIEIVARAFREESPALAAGQRLYRAVQQANIEIYDRSIAVPELCGMCTTLTFGVVDRGELTAVHVGDSRLYLVRNGEVTQLTKDHTVAAGKARIGLMSKQRALMDAERCMLTRSVGRELIVARDRLTRPLARGDVLVLCSDGLYTAVGDDELGALVAGRDAQSACRALLEAAKEHGAYDDATVAVLRAVGPTPERPLGQPGGIAAALRRVLKM